MGAEPEKRPSDRALGSARLGLDIGGTKLLGLLVDEAGSIVQEHTLPTGAARGPDAVLAACCELIEGLRDGAPPVASLGVGFAGLVDREAGLVRSSVILPGWDGLPLADRLAAALGLPVSLDNDATAAGWGEFVALQSRAARTGGAAPRDLLVLTVGTGIGGALFLGGRLQRGATGLAGEVGHMTVDRHGERCVCGRRGCLHTLASGTALTAAAGRLAAADPDWLLTTSGDRAADPAGAGTAPSLQAVGRAAAAGDERARRLVEAGAEALGIGIANLAQLFNPARVALCGGVLGLGDPWLGAVRQTVQREVFSEVWEALTVAPALLGSRSGAFGAAHLPGAAR